MKFNQWPVIPLATIAIALIGCSSDDSKRAEPIEIAWIAKGTLNTFFDISRAGAQLAEQELAAASGRAVTVHMMDPVTIADTNQMKLDQVTKIEDAVTMGVDVINVSVLDVALMTPAINAAVDAGVPVLTFDSDAPASKRLTYYGIDNSEAAVLLVDTLASMMGEKGQVAIMSVVSTSQTYMDRLETFYSEIAKYPGIEVVTPSALDAEGAEQDFYNCNSTAETTRAGCAEVLEDMLADYPDLKGVYMARGRVLRETPENLEINAPNWTGAVKGGALKVVAFDAPGDAIPTIQAGYAQMVIGQKMFGWGYDLVNLSFDIVTGARAQSDINEFTNSSFDVICENSIDEFAEKWQAKDFRSELPKCGLLE